VYPLNEICCDTCPWNPTCEEDNDFLASIGLGDPGDFEWGDDEWNGQP
jgi:hypothetical protein